MGVAVEPELRAAVAEFDNAAEVAPAMAMPEATPSEPDGSHEQRLECDWDQPPALAVEHDVPAEAVPNPVETERPRRGSTVREPAPIFMEDAHTQPQPLPSSPAAAEAPASGAETPSEAKVEDAPAQPRRTGWWARRFASNKR